MAMTSYEKGKFRFSETFNNSDGKTSGSAFIGVIIGLTATVSFLVGTVGWYFGIENSLEFLEKVLQMAGLSTLLLGVRKAVASLKKTTKPEELG